MSSRLRKVLASKLLQAVKFETNKTNQINELARAFLLRQGPSNPELYLHVRQLRNIVGLQAASASPPSTDFVKTVLAAGLCSESIDRTSHIASKSELLVFIINENYFAKETLSPSTTDLIDEPTQKIVVEFSSPNIAKPFHVGHLRSTIIGNVISNLYQAFGHDVVRINYLGDWGTQFGLLKIGMDAAGYTEAQIKENPIKYLFEAYVLGNKLAEDDATNYEKAREIFCNLENGSQEDLKEWTAYREYTVTELAAVYARLGIRFDEYAWESQYSKQKITDCLDSMTEKCLLTDTDGKQTIKIGDSDVTMLKSDGSTMYLTRDVAAIMDRQRRHKYDKMLYVVENGQHLHFVQLFEIVSRLDVENVAGLQHIKFGRINKMSTRKGTVIFLKDILDEARNISMEIQLNAPTTKIDADLIKSHTADVVGCSSIIINDLRRKRMANYDFDWNSALQLIGDSGGTLHLSHSRLCSLQEITGVKEAITCRPEHLTEPEAKALIYCIARYPEILLRSKDSQEPCILVKYCFELCKEIQRALKVLNVKNESNRDVQEQRMLLFMTAKRTLNKSMTILGLKPLEKM